MCVLGGQEADAHAVVGVWRSEDKLRCQSAPSTLFEAGSLVHCCVHQPGWAATFKGLSPMSALCQHRVHTTDSSFPEALMIRTWVRKLIQQAFNPPISLSSPSLFLNWLLKPQFRVMDFIVIFFYRGIMSFFLLIKEFLHSSNSPPSLWSVTSPPWCFRLVALPALDRV